MNHSQPGVSARETNNGTQEYAVGSFRFGNDTHPAARQEQLPCLTPPFLDRCTGHRLPRVRGAPCLFHSPAFTIAGRTPPETFSVSSRTAL